MTMLLLHQKSLSDSVLSEPEGCSAGGLHVSSSVDITDSESTPASELETWDSVSKSSDSEELVVKTGVNTQPELLRLGLEKKTVHAFLLDIAKVLRPFDFDLQHVFAKARPIRVVLKILSRVPGTFFSSCDACWCMRVVFSGYSC